MHTRLSSVFVVKCYNCGAYQNGRLPMFLLYVCYSIVYLFGIAVGVRVSVRVRVRVIQYH